MAEKYTKWDPKPPEEYTIKHLNAPQTTPPGFFLEIKFIWKAIDYDPPKDNIPDEARLARLGISTWADWHDKKYKYFGMWMKEWLSVQGKEYNFEKCTVVEIDDWLYWTYWTQKNRGNTEFCQKQAFIEEWLFENNHATTTIDLREIMLRELTTIDQQFNLTHVDFAFRTKS